MTKLPYVPPCIFERENADAAKRLHLFYEEWSYMATFIVVLLFLIGIFLIIKGGDLFVDAAAWIAEISGIPKLIIGATVVSFATTLPEMLVSVFAAMEGKVDMSIGNAVGSVTANIGLIMAISLICLPGEIRRRDYMTKSLLMLAASAIIVLGGIKNAINLPLSLALLIVLAVFFYENVSSAISATRTSAKEDKPEFAAKDVAVNIAKFILGAVGIVLGADLLVDNGSELARLVGVSERIIGVTLVAVGTSLPELVTTVTAIIKKQSSLSVGNILGANILDLTLILPVSGFIAGKPLPIAAASAAVDLPVCLLAGCVAVIPALILKRFSRWQGILLLVMYIAYVIFTCSI